MMGNSRKKIGLTLFVIIILSNISASQLVFRTQSKPIFFTLILKTNGGGVAPDYCNFLKQHCSRIGINVDIIVQDWPTFVGEIIAFRDFDICYMELGGNGIDPDFTGVYNENGSLNLFGYQTSMDWNEHLGTGTNEWYMKQGNLIMSPNPEERIQHYWAWQQYLMDKICPMAPTFSPRKYVSYWSKLIGYNYSEGILESWGKMVWSGAHTGQVSSDELVIADAAWSSLNPLYQSDSVSSFISSACLDPLIWYDVDLNVWPHLAKEFGLINDTWLRISTRESIKWGVDPTGEFENEYFDVYDVYFTLYAWKYLSKNREKFEWIEEMIILNQTTLDIFIDGDPTTSENEPYAPYLSTLNTMILPEHYLNQSQLLDKLTPDVTHPAWDEFRINCFGTGLFEIYDFSVGIETVLTIKADCWQLDPIITADPALDWINRFGFGAGWDGLRQLRIRIIPDLLTQMLELEAGTIDLTDVTWNPTKRDDYLADINFDIQSDTTFCLGFYGFNMRQVRPIIGNREPAPGDPTLSKGLCIRKAIAFAIDRFEINNVIHRGEYAITDSPIYPKMGIWNNPNIIRYNFDIDKARECMTRAGYDLGWEPVVDDFSGFGLFFLCIGFSFILPIPLIISFVKSIKHIRNLKKNNFWPFRKRSTVRIISIQEQGYSWKYEVVQ